MSIIERVDNTTHLTESRKVSQPTFPKSMKIEITSRCNFNCEYCGVKDRLRTMGDMTLQFYHNLIREAVKVGVKEVGLFLLGEPFLRKDLPDLITYAKQQGIEYVFITTNGSLCTKENLKACINAGLDSLKFSINCDKSKYMETHRVKADTYDYVIEQIKWLYHYKLENKLKKPITCVSSIENGDTNVEKEISQFVDEFYYLPMYNQAGTNNTKKFVGNPGRLGNMVDSIPCWGLFNCARVTWDGWLTACCFDHTGHFKIANLHDVSLTEAWNNYKFVNLRKQHLERNINDNICKKCLGINNGKGEKND